MELSKLPGKKSSVKPPGIDPGTHELVAQHLNHYATPGIFLLRTRKLKYKNKVARNRKKIVIAEFTTDVQN
jgi:hypothetical protein